MYNLKTHWEDVEIYSANRIFKSYGHYKIVVELVYKNKHGKFSSTTTDMEVIDNANEAETWEEKAQILYNGIESKIFDNIEEWIMEVDADENKIKSIKNQIQLLEELKYKGYNIIFCEDCGGTSIHKINEHEIYCPYCRHRRYITDSLASYIEEKELNQ